MNEQKVDILEDDILKISPDLLSELLKDRSTGKNIFWATDNYEQLGEGYQYKDEILIENITGKHTRVLRPRAVKSKSEQQRRIKQKAEVFTPAWVCNIQNNLVDEAWFGRKNVFNTEISEDDGVHNWIPTQEQISFEGTGKTWTDYVRETRIEITCGEAPYLVSRYDTNSGEVIPLEKRVGLLDRKMRVINENVKTIDNWKNWTRIAFQNIYGFEWQGDNLLLAREALLYTLFDYYADIRCRLGLPPKELHIITILSIANIISWNIWQMDGLKFVVPETCHEYDEVTKIPATLFEAAREEHKTCQCQGCLTGDNRKHNGVYCVIRNWDVYENSHKGNDELNNEECSDIRFIDLIKSVN